VYPEGAPAINISTLVLLKKAFRLLQKAEETNYSMSVVVGFTAIVPRRISKYSSILCGVDS
jgi:hypothetical protein